MLRPLDTPLVSEVEDGGVAVLSPEFFPGLVDEGGSTALRPLDRLGPSLSGGGDVVSQPGKLAARGNRSEVSLADNE